MQLEHCNLKNILKIPKKKYFFKGENELFYPFTSLFRLYLVRV